MTIVALEKVTLFGPADQRHEVLDELQRLGRVHLINLQGGDAREAADGLVSAPAREALKFLRTCPVQRRAAMRVKDFDSQAVIARALEVKRLQQTLSDERDAIEQAIEQVQPWGEFAAPDPSELRDLRLWFYVVPRHHQKNLASLNITYDVAAEDETSLYVVIVSPGKPDISLGDFVELDPRPLSVLQTRRDEIDEQLEDLYWARSELTRWTRLLQRSLDEADDRASRSWAERLSLCDTDVFAVQGWAPIESRAAIEAVAQRFGLAATFEPPGEIDQPPTLLRNPERVAGAENAVTFYITPGYRAWDPTPIMFVSFSLFFGMIMADAGYGLLMGIALLLFWRRLGKTANGHRFRYLLSAIIAVTIVFGMLAGSYFGLTPSRDSLLGRLRILDFENRRQMMALSILIGVIHLSLANAITAWHSRHSPAAIGALGWIVMMWGALMMAAGLAELPYASVVTLVGKGFVISGALAILIFSSKRPLRSSRVSDWIGRIADGFAALTGVSKLFGDVLSYLRLFALGLASAQLAVTFNQLASDMTQYRGVGLLIAAVILIVGHGINLVLGLMGGVVHGLRLNCIEFFNWSLTEEGHPFRCYQKKVLQ